MLNTRSATNRFPFTATQWQELELQALIYNYMVSGVPVPPELLYSVKRSLESSLESRVLFPRQPIRWGKADPEPGRCRRTDGRKWRCSKEAYPDSKYCERHMHRGRSRSRKPEKLASTTTTTTATKIPLTSINRNLPNTTVSPFSTSYSFSHLSSSAKSEVYAHQNSSYGTFLNPFLFTHSSSSGPPGSSFSPLKSTPRNLSLESGSSARVDKECRYSRGMGENVGDKAFFPDGLGSARGVRDSYNQLTMSSYKGYSQSQFQTFADTSQEEQQAPGQHCFVLGTDIIKLSATRPIELEKETETQKPLHHFFDEWEPKDADSWLDLASSSRPRTADD